MSSTEASAHVSGDRLDVSSYRPDIDGLRAIAVMSVVLCHAKLGLPGGFVGVDVFFVISGYLITGLIVRDLNRGTFSMFAFWERRVRRILPALFVMAVATSVLAWLILFPGELRAYGNTLASLALGASNIPLWRQAGYFDTAAQYKFLLHTWSLAVEEQFYLVTPILLWVLYRLINKQQLLLVLGVCAGLSFALSVVGTQRFPSANFFMLPTRAWELLLGSILSLLPPLASRRWREAVVAMSAAAILLPCFLYDERTPFPGLAALPVALGSAGVIWAGMTRTNGQTLGGRILELKPLVWIGLISYSLYLWHWPLLAVSHYFGDVALSTRLSLVVASIAIAFLSWLIVERPFRRRTLLPRRGSLFAVAIASLGLLFLFGAIVRSTDGMPSRFTGDEKRILEMAEVDKRFIHEVKTVDVAERLPMVGMATGSPRVLVWGDSHAMAFLPAIDAAARNLNVGAWVATHSSNPPVIDFVYYVPNGFNQDAIAFNKAVLARALRGDVEVVVFAGKWGLYMGDERFLPRLHETIEKLQASGIRVALVLDVPFFPYYVPHRLFLAQKLKTGVEEVSLDEQEMQSQRRPLDELVASLKDVRVIDPWDTFTKASASHRFPAADAGGSFYRDDDHLSTYGALKLTPLFEDAFKSLGLSESRATPKP